MKKRLSVILTVLVCVVTSFSFFLIPQEAQTVRPDPRSGDTERKDVAAVEPSGGLLYFVNTTSDTIVVSACANGDAGCSLRGAIQAANSHIGPDGIEISLPAGSVINLTQALPDVTETVGIAGPGADLVTVRRNTVADYRIFNVTTNGTVTFSGLTISNGSSSLGAGIQNSSGTVNVTNCAIRDNRGGTAGGIFNNTGTVNVTNSTLTGNSTTDAGVFGGGGGGGIYNHSGTLNVYGSTFSGNSALNGAGIYNKNNGTVNVTNSTLSGNASVSDGGGISNDGVVGVSNSTVSGNSAASLTDPGIGGGIANRGTANIRSSIIALNTAGTVPDVSGAFVSFGFNLIGKNNGSTGFTATTDLRGTIASPLNPMLDPAGLQNNGGPTRTIAPLANSPAIDKATSSGLTIDQRGVGFPRTVENPAIPNAAGGNGTDIGAFERAGQATFDFDGDGKTDIAIFRAGPAEWWTTRSSNASVFAAQFGTSTDRLVPGDYTGDGKADIAVWRPSNGNWFVLRSEDFSFFSFPFGTSGDVPAPADFDADGKADAAVFRSATGTWFIRRSSDGATTIEGFGANGDVPVPGDYDGDGRSDIAIFRTSLGQWWLNRSTAGVIVMTFGGSSDKPVQGDYTGDGKADVAFFRPSTGEWFILRSENFSFFSFPFGTIGDIAAPGDYDGDGKHDATVFRPSNATWFSQRTTAGTLIQQFGVTGDRPIPNAFVP